MGLQTIPPASSAPFAGAGSVVAQGITPTGKGYWSTTLATGNYIINGIISGYSVSGWLASTNNPTNAAGTYSVGSYSNNIGISNVTSGTPNYIKITSSDTIFFVSGFGVSTTWQYNLTDAGIQRTMEWGWNKWCSNNSPGDKWTFLGRNGSSNAIQVANEIVSYAAGAMSVGTAQNSGLSSTTVSSTSTEMECWAYCNNAYFLTIQGQATIYRSTNLTTWSAIAPTGLSATIKDYCFGSFNNYYVLVTDSATSTANIASSTDGVTWTTRAGAISAGMKSVTAGTNVYVAVGAGIQSSTDSITWTSRTNPNSGVTYGRVAYNSTLGVFLAWAISGSVASTGQVAYSTNGTTWTAVAVLPFASATTASSKTQQMLMVCNDEYNGKYQLTVADGLFWWLAGNVALVSTNGTKFSPVVWGRNYNDNLTVATLWSSTNSSWIGYAIYGNGYAMPTTPNQGQFVIYNSTVS